MADEKEQKAAPVKGPNDPVRVKCGKLAWPKVVTKPNEVPVEYGELPKELAYNWRGTKFIIPVGGESETMPREAADFLLQRAARYWTLKAELSILEPSFK